MEYRNKGVYCLDFLLELSLAFADVPLHLYRCSPLTILNFFFDSTKMSSPQRLHGEPSLSQRRALAISMTSARQLVKSKGAVKNIYTSASEKSLKRCTKSILLFFRLHVSLTPS